jgi:predicted ATP-dependent Lon-type protease
MAIIDRTSASRWETPKMWHEMLMNHHGFAVHHLVEKLRNLRKHGSSKMPDGSLHPTAAMSRDRLATGARGTSSASP